MSYLYKFQELLCTKKNFNNLITAIYEALLMKLIKKKLKE